MSSRTRVVGFVAVWRLMRRLVRYSLLAVLLLIAGATVWLLLPTPVPDDWTFGGSWPYEPRWFESADGRMHYVDVGPADGKPVVLVHGNPTST